MAQRKRLPLVYGTAKYKQKQKIKKDLYIFEFEMLKPSTLDFVDGQYISIHIKDKIRRSYSVLNSNTESRTEIRLLVKLIGNGVGSAFLNALEKDDIINLIGRIGFFNLPDTPAKNLVFISTGTGFSPINSIVTGMINNKIYKNHQIFVYIGNNSANEVIFEDKYLKYLKTRKITEYKCALSKTTKKHKKHHFAGRVQQFITEYPKKLYPKTHFFICGNGMMIDSIKEYLILNGCNKKNIINEKFY